MGTSKSTITLFSSQTLTAGEADQTSAIGNLSGGYGAKVYVKITNGAAAPTVAAQWQPWVSPDNTNWFKDGGPYVAGLDNDGIYYWAPPEDIGAAYFKITAGSNTVEDVTIDAYLTHVTALV